MLNNAADQGDIANGTELAKERRIPINPIKFGRSGAQYRYDKETNSIYKGIASIKYLNATVADKLAELRASDYETFSDVLIAVAPILDERQLNILIKLGYFSEYGKSKELLRLAGLYVTGLKKGDAKTVSPDKFPADFPFSECCRCYGKDGKRLARYPITDMRKLLKLSERYIISEDGEDFSLMEMIAFQNEYLGYVDYVSNKPEDIQKIYVEAVFPVKRRSDQKIFAYNIISRSIGTGKAQRFTVFASTYEANPFKAGSIIEVVKFDKNNRGYWCIFGYNLLV